MIILPITLQLTSVDLYRSQAILAALSDDAVLGAAVVVGMALLGGLIKAMTDISIMKSQVKELWEDRRVQWDYLQSRGEQEAVNKGLGKKNSPLSINESPYKEEIINLLNPILGDLIDIDHSVISTKNDDDYQHQLFRKIVGSPPLLDKISKSLCQRFGLAEGGCVALAISFLRHVKGDKEVMPKHCCEDSQLSFSDLSQPKCSF